MADVADAVPGEALDPFAVVGVANEAHGPGTEVVTEAKAEVAGADTPGIDRAVVDHIADVAERHRRALFVAVVPLRLEGRGGTRVPVRLEVFVHDPRVCGGVCDESAKSGHHRDAEASLGTCVHGHLSDPSDVPGIGNTIARTALFGKSVENDSNEGF